MSVDEAGRGCLAGPVALGLVSFGRESLERIRSGAVLRGIRDSKKLPEAIRKRLASEIKELCSFWKVVFVSPKTIDRININQAIFYGINRGLPKDAKQRAYLFVDGNYKLALRTPILGYTSIPKGDDIVPSISAASILAKTHRDAWMEEMDRKYPGYGFSKHKGYGTSFHREKLIQLGASPIHRLSFLRNLRSWESEELPFPNLAD
ncbi:ribonuclease HII [Leptospira ryugenii]|uniref:ribonuclease HII n=1 Tax=Leptospira ryugenii TaxID=1917863 RepID=UPI000D5928B3|nr:ribonuclease HII [Leptospira ryugenii]